ncbi:MAG: tRNA (adenosine(37)-N6)-threonylcarbamoyltransferase complex ATPase subunit type 1 TsaE [Candidatus Marinimicrobia bacterium]|nr:tRNA (adenosine(37)-N6)-threonylcarbamoyltransferase complex ATPase subunit type 1 TsaE [Candidatus Neomarinimicrobiota bacterium]MBT3945429.1 tRNA (adenosine(37)-N6)-threonylcarbamoyltransferase complex ATPase subunit type 1 TsaE [Candidatus Neomarinimicrobiota bacterium]MBT4155751.1 tRNA (adenosine(37)-N6)-threonylcarbamoyltransferase complex ATPase subunit type 1 TsaE [Candidatus Neomarinimicrobiota bacterium]MBT5116002.1 tRNA (adenosine(37)-N6)-threonylcarbamoyltransferase complex ATPase 
MIFESNSMDETQTFAHQFAQQIPVGSVVALIGNLGTGKTTFTQGFAKSLGIEERVGSPTFKLVSEYEGSPHNLYHIDAYRLDNGLDFLNIGGEVFLIPKEAVTLIEWADIIKEILPPNTIYLTFSRVDGNPNGRRIILDGLNEND